MPSPSFAHWNQVYIPNTDYHDVVHQIEAKSASHSVKAIKHLSFFQNFPDFFLHVSTFFASWWRKSLEFSWGIDPSKQGHVPAPRAKADEVGLPVRCRRTWPFSDTKRSELVSNPGISMIISWWHLTTWISKDFALRFYMKDLQCHSATS